MNEDVKNVDRKASGSPQEQYEDSYLKWKSWGGRRFGNLRKKDEGYFSSEIRRTKAKFGNGTKVLEIGFGNGEFLTYCQRRRWSAIGTEVNPALVAMAKERGFDVRLLDNLSEFPSGSFDMVVAFDVLEHIPQDLLLGVFCEIRRVLGKNGVFIARFPNGDSPFGLRYQNGDVTHVTTIGAGKAKFLAGKAGMEMVFLGAEAMPILGGGAFHFVHRMIALPFRFFLNLFINLIFFPGARGELCSPNLTMVLKRLRESTEASSNS